MSEFSSAAWEELKGARHRAHKLFDELWTSGQMSRKHAYIWMQKVMQKTKREAHIAKFSIEECARLIDEVQRLRKKVPREA